MWYFRADGAGSYQLNSKEFKKNIILQEQLFNDYYKKIVINKGDDDDDGSNDDDEGSNDDDDDDEDSNVDVNLYEFFKYNYLITNINTLDDEEETKYDNVWGRNLLSIEDLIEDNDLSDKWNLKEYNRNGNFMLTKDEENNPIATWNLANMNISLRRDDIDENT